MPLIFRSMAADGNKPQVGPTALGTTDHWVVDDNDAEPAEHTGVPR